MKRRRSVSGNGGESPTKKQRVIHNAEEAVDYEDDRVKLNLPLAIYSEEWSAVPRAKRNQLMMAVRKKRADEKAKELQNQVQQARKQARLKANVDDKAFTIALIQMGQGDCFVIFTPGGKIIMIDCGTTASDEDRGGQTYKTNVDDNWSDQELTAANIPLLPIMDLSLRLKAVLGTKNKIDYLILTHSDRDHYNQLKGLLGTSMKFGEVYHSDELSNYSANGTAAYIRSQAESADKIFRVIHNDPKSKKIKLQPEKGNALELDQESNRGYLLLDEDNCKIWFLASDVTFNSVSSLDNPITDDDSTQQNRGSLVTLIEVFGKKILICGDATIVTEQYLLATSEDASNKEAYKDLDILQVPHHGTRLTSSSQDFVDHTNPRNVAVSSARKDQQHRLPQQSTLRRYFWNMRDSKRPLEDKDHEILYWMQGRGGSPIHCWSTLKRPIYVTGSQGSFGWTISRTDATVKMEYGLITGPADETTTTT